MGTAGSAGVTAFHGDFWRLFPSSFPDSVLSIAEAAILLVPHGHPVYPANPVQHRMWGFCAFLVIF